MANLADQATNHRYLLDDIATGECLYSTAKVRDTSADPGKGLANGITASAQFAEAVAHPSTDAGDCLTRGVHQATGIDVAQHRQRVDSRTKAADSRSNPGDPGADLIQNLAGNERCGGVATTAGVTATGAATASATAARTATAGAASAGSTITTARTAATGSATAGSTITAARAAATGSTIAAAGAATAGSAIAAARAAATGSAIAAARAATAGSAIAAARAAAGSTITAARAATGSTIASAGSTAAVSLRRTVH